MTEAAPLDTLKTLCAADQYPKLDDAILQSLLVKWQKTEATETRPATYDLNGAAHDAWTIKAGMTAKDFGYSGDGARYDRNQVHDHCLTMAALYAPAFVC